MKRVVIETYIRAGETFVPVAESARYAGDPNYVEGAISLVIDGTELLGLELMDDVNWLWPLIVQALDEYRRIGSGKRGFPDQPIAFSVELARDGHALVRVFDGKAIDRSAVAPDNELFDEVARAGLVFFDELQRICPGTPVDAERGTLTEWHA